LWYVSDLEEGPLGGLIDVDLTTTAPTNGDFLKYDGANWVNGAVAYSEVTGTPTLAPVATTGAYSDLNDSVVVQQFNATATASAISSNALHVFRFYGNGGFTLTLSNATAVNGFVLFNNISGSDVTVNGGTFRANGEGVTGGSSSITVKAGERRLYYVETVSLYLEVNSTLIEHNADVNISSPANGEALIYNSASGDWENGTVSANVAALNDIDDVSAASPNDGDVLAYNSTSGDWEATAQSGGSAPVIYRTGDTYGTTTIPSTGTFAPILYAAGVVGLEEIFILNPTGNMDFVVFDANHASTSNGFKYNIKNISSSSSVTVKTSDNASSTIDDYETGSGITLSKNSSVTLVADKDNDKWYII
jgi:hypothetical protein